MDDWQPPRVTAVLMRALGAGALAGLGTGALLGTLILPVFGTIAGAIIGTPVGAAVGLVNGIVLIVVTAYSPARRAAMLAGGVTSAVVALSCVAAAGTGGDARVSQIAEPILVIVVTALGAALGPYAAFGASGGNPRPAVAQPERASAR